MTLRDLTALAIRISGVVLFVLIIAQLPEYLKAYIIDGGNAGSYIFWVYFLPLVIPGLASLLLFSFPYSISNKIITTSKEQNESKYDSAEIEVILIRLLGLLLLYNALSDLVFHLADILIFRNELGNNFPIEAYNYSYLFATIVEFIFSFWLLAGTSSVVRIVKKLRRK